MSPNFERYLVSSVVTFLTTFLVVLGGEISSGVPVVWTWTVVAPLVMVAARAAVKSVVESWSNRTGDPTPA